MNFVDRLQYDPETGSLFRLDGQWKGKKAGWLHDKGYIALEFEGSKYLAHRVVWFMHKGQWPTYEIDHINGVKTDNRIENLREATGTQNQANSGKQANNTSGYKGVTIDKRNGKWLSRIQYKNKFYHLGSFFSIEDAAAAYEKAAREFFGEFARVA